MSFLLKAGGVLRVIRKFEALQSMTKTDMKAAGRVMLDTLQANMPDYPAAPLGSKYIRTLNLFDALRSTEGDHPMSLNSVKMVGGDAVVTVGVSGYGPYVVGVQQAWMHAGRWWKLVAYVREMSSTVKEALRGKVSEWIASAGFGM